MQAGADAAAWQHTSSIMAMLINANPFREEGAKVIEPADFDPYADHIDVAPIQANLKELRGAFVK